MQLPWWVPETVTQCHLCVIRPHGSCIHLHTDFVQGKSHPLRGTHLLFYQESNMWFLNLLISISILCTLIPTSSPGSPHANFFPPSVTFSQVHPYCPYTISSNQRTKKEWEKNVTVLLVLISRATEAGKNKGKILSLPKNQWSLSGTSKKCCNLYGCSAKFQASAPNPG